MWSIVNIVADNKKVCHLALKHNKLKLFYSSPNNELNKVQMQACRLHTKK